MNIKDFHFVAEMLYKRSGLVVGEEKAYLLESRLNSVARRWEFKTFDDLVASLRGPNAEKLTVDVVEAMTTNESFFFRDQKPFDQLRDIVLPQLIESRASQRRLRIWSAACASGQEPYTIAMILKEMSAKLAGWNLEILATDLSNEILEKSRSGVYTQFEVQRGLPINLLVKHFTKVGDKWEISSDIKQMVKFKQLNLLNPLVGLGKFDVIFCRNVLIYFDPPTKSKVLSAAAGVMESDGYLYLGGAETVLGVCDRFQLLAGQRGLYSLTGGEISQAGVSKFGMAS